MKEVRSTISVLLGHAGFRRPATMDCDAAQELMSAFIDSMLSPGESEGLQLHLTGCDTCRRQLQSFISLRSLLTRVEQPAPPEDMVLETRVMLSQARNRDTFRTLETRYANVLKPIAVPAVLGVVLTMLFFAVLLGAMISNGTVMANDRAFGDRESATYKPVQTPEKTRVWLAFPEEFRWDEPIIIETVVAQTGRVVEYRVLHGSQSPEMDRLLRHLMYYSEFTPATVFGRPVRSKAILSFGRPGNPDEHALQPAEHLEILRISAEVTG